mgnify:FL=1
MRVLVIGGGAAGMMAALTAAENGHQVTLLERQARVGRKLLATGNGRCNLTNHHASPTHYHGGEGFCGPALAAFDVGGTLQYFAGLGLLTTAEDSGRVYPFSNMAGSVLDVLRFALENHGIDLRTACPVTGLRKKDGRFLVRTESGDALTADRVILAAGGAAGGKVGGVMDGYQLAGSLGHHRTALYPSLVQIRTEPTYPRALKGVKAECGVTLRRGGETVAQNRGEVLFTEYGVSGPAIFDLSRAAATAGGTLCCVLNFFPDWEQREVLDWLRQRRAGAGEREAGTLLTGALHSRLGQMVCKAAGFTSQRAAGLDDAALRRIAAQAVGFPLPVTGVCGFDQAQVTAGGLRCDEFDPRTMESRLVPGFYACGEVLDIDGDCGGYNLQWAWSSGRMAGQLRTI